MRQVHILTHHGRIDSAYSSAELARKARDRKRAQTTPYYDPETPYHDYMVKCTEEFQSWNIETHPLETRAPQE